jgi:hypothetical protein
MISGAVLACMQSVIANIEKNCMYPSAQQPQVSQQCPPVLRSVKNAYMIMTLFGLVL